MGKSAFDVYSKKKKLIKPKNSTKKVPLMKKKIKKRPKEVGVAPSTVNIELKNRSKTHLNKPHFTLNKKKKKEKKSPIKIKASSVIKFNKITLCEEIALKSDEKSYDNKVNIHSYSEDNFHTMPEEAFSYLIAPLKSSDFFANYWEKECLHVVRKSDTYYKDFLSSKKLDEIIRNNALYYTKNIDVVTYEDGERKTHNPEGRAVPVSVWDYYSNGCSIRLLNPQTYNKKIRNLLAMLQEYFGTMAGANVYLTPPGSQGFAPHYDDIEAIVLQIEGRKHWKIYKPKNVDHSLPRYSSKNFPREELGTPVELTVEAGDMLYFPRGYIHEACTDPDSHSLHITVSVYQNTAYVDLIEKSLMQSLHSAAAANIEYRQGLPIQYLKHLGVTNSDTNTSIRNQIIETVKNLVSKLSQYISVDDGADQLGRKFMYDSLPPQLLPSERSRSCKEDGDVLQNGAVKNKGVFEPDTCIRLIRYHSIRLAVENNINKLYYSTENANVYHGEEEQYLEVSDNMVETVRALLRSYPQYSKIEDLPSDDQVTLMHVISDLWEKGLIITQEPLAVYEND